MSRTAIFVAEGFEEIEALTVVDLLRRAKIEIQMISVSDSLFITGSHGITVKCDALYGAVDFAELEMIILPGGLPGTTNLEAFKPLMEQLAEFDRKGK